MSIETLQENESVQSGKLNGLNFVISGIFQHYSREEIQKLIVNNGGKKQAAISANTDYVVAGENMGPTKREKAKNLNIPIITEEDLLFMLE